VPSRETLSDPAASTPLSVSGYGVPDSAMNLPAACCLLKNERKMWKNPSWIKRLLNLGFFIDWILSALFCYCEVVSNGDVSLITLL
jgi:hypothetical protein